jgi:hypothetical protein
VSHGLRTNFRFVFFIFGAGRKVGRIYKRHGDRMQGRMVQKLPEQMIVDLAKTARAKTPSEIMEHANIGNGKPIGQMRKATPLLLLRQATD